MANHSKSSTLTAFLIGIAAGAAGAYLAHTDNREKVKKAVDQLKQEGNKIIQQTTKKIEEVAETTLEERTAQADIDASKHKEE